MKFLLALQAFLLICLILLVGIKHAEVLAVRADQAQMKAVYDSFLSRKIKDKRLGEMIRPHSLAVFNSNQGYVACAVIEGGK